MTDIFADWKTHRFVVAPDLWPKGHPHVIVLTDIPFWVNHIDQLSEWCQVHGCMVQGMTVEIPSDPALTLFYLRWR